MITVNVTPKDEAIVVALEGEVDFYSSPELRKVLVEVTGKHPPVIVVELTGIKYMDSSGLATLIEGFLKTKRYSGKFLLAGPRQTIRNLFSLSKLDKVFEIFDSLDEALNSLDAQ